MYVMLLQYKLSSSYVIITNTKNYCQSFAYPFLNKKKQ